MLPSIPISLFICSLLNGGKLFPLKLRTTSRRQRRRCCRAISTRCAALLPASSAGENLLLAHQSFTTETRFQTLTAAHAFVRNHMSRDNSLQHDERAQLCRPSFSPALPAGPAAVARRYSPRWWIVSTVFHSFHPLAYLLCRRALLLAASSTLP